MLERVYLLRQILDDPRYEGFAASRSRGFRPGSHSIVYDFMPDSFDSRDWTVPRLTPIWKPLRVSGRVKEFNDYPCLNLSVPAFSRRAATALADFLDVNGELLPLATALGEYYAYNVLTVVDALDQKKSVFDIEQGSVLPDEIVRYEFKPSVVRRLSIFRIVEDPIRTYVTQKFVDRAEKHALNGFDFQLLWPLPPGVEWRKLAQKAGRKRNRDPAGRPVKGNSVIIRMRLSGSRPTSDERRRAEAILDELDEKLLSRTSKTAVIGSLEGHEFVKRDFRIFLSCPDADALAKMLLPWLRKVKWDKPGVQGIKRYGEYVDPEAREEVFYSDI
jgi:hypothetical protein